MRLADYLAERKITQAEFAELVDAHPITVNRLCNGRAMASKRLMQTIALVTGNKVTAGDLAEAYVSAAPPKRGDATPQPAPVSA